MSPLKRSNNVAARMGRWSANHWKTAVFGWLAFVVASVVIGGAGRHEVPRAGRPRRRRGRHRKQDHRSGLPAVARRAGRDRPDPVQDPHRRRSGVQGRNRGRREDARHVPEGAEARLSARRGPPRPDLGRPPRGDGPVQPEGRLRPDNRVHRHDRRRRRQDRCSAIRPSTSRSSAAPAPARPSTRRSPACSRPPA